MKIQWVNLGEDCQDCAGFMLFQGLRSGPWPPNPAITSLQHSKMRRHVVMNSYEVHMQLGHEVKCQCVFFLKVGIDLQLELFTSLNQGNSFSISEGSRNCRHLIWPPLCYIWLIIVFTCFKFLKNICIPL